MVQKQTKIEDKNEFFDRDPVKNSSCSLWIVLTILVIILAVGVGMILYEKSKLFNSNKNINISTSDIASKIQKSNIEQSNPDKTIISISEQDLSNIIISKNVDFPLKNPKVTITTEKIIISGKTGSGLISLNTEVGIIPKLSNEKVTLEIVDIKTAGVSSPQKVKDLINSQLSVYLDKVASNLGDYKVESVELKTGYIVLAVKK